MNPIISIIVPVYNVEHYLRQCVDSILVQTFRDFELILVDDGSPDACPAICDEYAATDKRVHVIHQQNGGLSAARNTALDWMFANSQTKYVTFIDSDDWVSENYIEVMIEGARLGFKIVCVECDHVSDGEECFPDEIHVVSYSEASPEEYWVHLGRHCTTAWGKLFERSFYQELRFPLGKIHEDEFTTHFAIFAAQKVVYVPAPLYHYRQRNGSITRSGWTESELDFIDAVQGQIPFFTNIGAKSAKRRSERVLLGLYGKAIRLGRHFEFREPLRRLLKELEWPILSNKHLYCLAYPIRTKWQWPLIRLWDVVRRRGPIGAFLQGCSHLLRSTNCHG